MGMFSFKSYCWSFGTTSFRTKNFNFSIEKQLKLLKTFWEKPGMDEMEWSDSLVQENYYNHLLENGFITGEANNKAKDAREKTSGLLDIGLIDENHYVSDVGLELLNVVLDTDYKPTGILHIPEDSYIYLKQLLKFGLGFDGKYIRPFVLIIYLLCELNYFTYDEFKYIVPLCTCVDDIEKTIQNINNLRKNKTDIDTIIFDKILSMNNYKEAYNYLMENDVNEDVICEIAINRKSKNYDKPYYDLYIALKDMYLNKNINSAIDLYTLTYKISIGGWWRNLLFNTNSKKVIVNSPQSAINKTAFDNIKTEKELKCIFFKYLHLYKIKANLSDYFDLNRRYLRTTNCISFKDNVIKLESIPKIVFKNVKEKLLDIMRVPSDSLYINVSLNNICNGIEISEESLISLVNDNLGISINSINELFNLEENDRLVRFNKQIDAKFSCDNLIKLLDAFEKRDDNYIFECVTNDADIPTIFEYVLGICWYIVSERNGNILDYMKLSLDADLLPKTHATGGEADIVYKYNKTEYYPKHIMLLEATLAESTGQRHMEMEPVTRHLGNYLCQHSGIDYNDYCVFITTKLFINLISDFRNRKTMIYYDTTDNNKSVNGMKIIPIETKHLKYILKHGIKYKDIYKYFDDIFYKELQPKEWFDEYINNKFTIE